MRAQVVLIKIAAIGDVALACRALSKFHENFEDVADFHWVIDQTLIPLARSLTKHLGIEAQINWIPIDGRSLLRGSLTEKVQAAAGLYRTIKETGPSQVVLLHRDWRYRVLTRLSGKADLIAIDRKASHELEIYDEAFRKLALLLDPPRRSKATSAMKPSVQSRRMGVLIGGAQNQKTSFLEKRWPEEHLIDFLKKVLAAGKYELVLFGGKEDTQTGRRITGLLPTSSSIKNLVGSLPLEKLPEELSKLELFVSIDSGLAHIASAVMTEASQKVFTLFGPTDPKTWRPIANGAAKAHLLYKSKACSPCYLNDGNFSRCKFTGSDFQNCMKDILPEEVFDLVRRETS
ncbi:MAG: glycosyltransferase family 9 protein [Bdellovibrionota bacterium]